nr:hypothetical protein [Enterobacter cloacae complex sp. ECL78]
MSLIQVDVPKEKGKETEIKDGEVMYSPKQLTLGAVNARVLNFIIPARMTTKSDTIA